MTKIRSILFINIVLLLFLVMLPLTAKASSSLSLGSASVTSGGNTCPPSADCTNLRVSCSSLDEADDATIAEYNPTSKTRGLVVLFTGTGGTSWYLGGKQVKANFLSELRSDGFKVIEVAWVNPWVRAANGERAGISKLACRPSTVIKWIYDNKYKPLNITVDKIGKCGFCVSGNSGGAAQTMYALAFYGLDSIIDAALPSSGPPYSAYAKGCLNTHDAYTYNPNDYPYLDGNYGYLSGGGPCENHDSSWTSHWNSDGIDTGSLDYYFADTRIVLLLGGEDQTMQAHVGDYYNKLVASGTPYLTKTVVAGAPHQMNGVQSGLDAIRAAILADTGVAIGGGSGAGGGSGSGSSSNNSDKASSSNDKQKQADGSKTTEVKDLGDVPEAVLGTLTNPTSLFNRLKGTYGWLIGIGLLLILGAAGLGGYLLYRHRHKLPWLKNLPPKKINQPPKQAQTSKTSEIPTPVSDQPPEVIEPTDKEQLPK